MTLLTYNLNNDGPSFQVAAGQRTSVVYVSDFLESLLDAEQQRALVRDITDSTIGQMPDEVGRLAHYYGGKCMGYPAVWLLKHALEIEDQKLIEVAALCKASIFLSLTTSIVDDWLDKDTEVSVAPVSLMYMLMVGGLGDLKSENFPAECALQKLREVTEHLLSVERCASLAHREKLQACKELASDAGIKIGHFHELIATEFCNANKVRSGKADALGNIANKFGCWCAFLDDVIDLRSDFEAGNWVSVPALDLAFTLRNDCGDSGFSLAGTEKFESLSLDCQARMIDRAGLKLGDLAAEAIELGLVNLGAELLRVEENLRDYLDDFLASAEQS